MKTSEIRFTKEETIAMIVRSFKYAVQSGDSRNTIYDLKDMIKTNYGGSEAVASYTPGARKILGL